MQQVADIVLAAARRAAVDGTVTLPQIQAQAEVQQYVLAPSRVIDLMAQLEERHAVRMTARHPVCRWRIEEQ